MSAAETRDKLAELAKTVAAGGGGGGGGGISARVTITVPAMSTEHTETVAFTGCTALMKVHAAVAPHVDTAENGPEGLDIIAIACTAGAGTATISIFFREIASGPISLDLIGA